MTALQIASAFVVIVVAGVFAVPAVVIAADSTVAWKC